MNGVRTKLSTALLAAFFLAGAASMGLAQCGGGEVEAVGPVAGPPEVALRAWVQRRQAACRPARQVRT
jgi:hypothetical protein